MFQFQFSTRIFPPEFALTISWFSVASPCLAGSIQGLHKAELLENQEQMESWNTLAWEGPPGSWNGAPGPAQHPPKSPPVHPWEHFHWAHGVFMAIVGFSPHPSHPLAIFSFPLGSHSSKWTGDGFNNTEWFLFMQKPATLPLPASLTDSLCSLSYFLGQQFQH